MLAKGKETISKLFIIPTVIVLAMVSLYPFLFGIISSLFQWNWGHTPNFIGFRNYIEIFTSKDFYRVLYNTLRFALIACTIEISLGFYLAVQIDKLNLGHGIIKGFLMAPLMIAGIIVALMSKVLFDPYIGIIYRVVNFLGASEFTFYGSPDTAMGTIIAVDVWWQTAFIFIILLAGLQGISREVLEAAEMEGAGEFQIFWTIKFPLMFNLLITIIIFRLIDILKIFDLVFGTTGGGPNLSTEVFQTYAYRTAFKFREIGMAMAIVMVFSMIMLSLCIIFHRLSREPNE